MELDSPTIKLISSSHPRAVGLATDRLPQICQSWNLHPRDVRPLDSNNALSAYLYHGRQNLVATILPRRKEAIVVNLLYIRALLLRDEVLILDSAEGLDSGLHKVYMANLTVSTTSDGRVRGEELSDFEG